jgi:hypothetical protein
MGYHTPVMFAALFLCVVHNARSVHTMVGPAAGQLVVWVSTGLCLTRFGGLDDPYNAVGFQECRTGAGSAQQLWTYNNSTGAVCISGSSSCLVVGCGSDNYFGGAQPTGVLLAMDNQSPTAFEINTATGSIYVRSKCAVQLNVQLGNVATLYDDGPYGVGFDCKNPAQNEVFALKTSEPQGHRGGWPLHQPPRVW